MLSRRKLKLLCSSYSFGSFFQYQESKAFFPLIGSEATLNCFGTHQTEGTIVNGVCRKKRKKKKFRKFPASKENDLSAGCLLRVPPREASFSISVNPYTRRSDVREVLLSKTKHKLLCSSYLVSGSSEASILAPVLLSRTKHKLFCSSYLVFWQ